MSFSNPSLKERFTEGDCHILAQTMHEATGWRIGTFSGTTGRYPQTHAFVVMPDGNCLDIQGVCTQQEMLERWFPHRWSMHCIVTWTADELRAAAPWWVDEPTWHASKRIAERVARRILWHGWSL